MAEELLIPKSAKILIVAPHPDDESIGCGGILVKYPKQCEVILLTNGAKGHKPDMSDEECIKIRYEEFKKVMEIVNVPVLKQCGIEDGQLKELSNHIPELSLEKYDFIFVPHGDERHRDHCAAYEYICSIYKKQKCQAMLLGYEISRPIRQPSHYTILNEFVDKKKLLISQYTSQLEIEDYINLGIGLNMYRGAAFKVGLAEAYEKIDFTKENFDLTKRTNIKRILKQIKKQIRKKIKIH